MKHKYAILRYAVLGLAALIMGLPVFWAICASLRPTGDSWASGNVFFGSAISLESYAKVLELAPFGRYYINSFLQVALIIGGQLASASLAAFAFARWRFPGDRLLFTLILVQMMIPFAALLVGNFQTVGALGLYDTIPGIAVPFMGSAFGTFLLRQSFLEIPRDFVEAAELDGCRWDQVLRLVFLPNAQAAAASFVLSSFSWHWNDFLWPLIITQSETVRPITTGLARFTQMGEIGAQWSLLAAATLLVTAPLFVLFVAFRKQFLEGYLNSGIK
jgi:sn-glycerol 3-phosphate transport system permease protein